MNELANIAAVAKIHGWSINQKPKWHCLVISNGSKVVTIEQSMTPRLFNLHMDGNQTGQWVKNNLTSVELVVEIGIATTVHENHMMFGID